MPPYRPGMAHDFDFLQGTWHSTHRRLVAPLGESDEWEEFTGHQVARAIFDGAGNMDEITFPDKGWSGLTVRLYNPETELWSLHWISSRRDVIEPPQVGRFVDGRGEFFGDDVYEGTPIKVRYVWSDITPTSAHWEQAFSTDGGQTWETNWLMELTRVD
jgi:hypothetical protein